MSTLKEKANLDKTTKVVIFDFGGRNASALNWAAKLKDQSKTVIVVTVGSSPDAGDGVSNTDTLGIQAVIGNAQGLRLGAMENLGVGRYYDKVEKAWAKFKKDGGLPGIDLDISDGLDAMKAGWDGLAAGTIPGTKALLYRI